MSAALDSARLVTALRDPAAYPHHVDGVECIETHISWVLLTGKYAYKIKKPVNLGFLDFTTLAARRHFCEEELRLNRRLAPELYAEVVPITGSVDAPRIAGRDAPFEYAVKMRQFEQACVLDDAARQGCLAPETVVALAHALAQFHSSLQPQLPALAGDPAAGLAPAAGNFAQLEDIVAEASQKETLSAIRAWTLRTFDDLMPVFTLRRARGFIRECHGDLHLGNIALVDGAAVPFDCLEFNRDLRWIDVIDEAAFLTMDLEAHGRRDLAHVFLSAYLEAGGDYGGVSCLPFYFVYRAMVRAKVNLIRSQQPGLSVAARANAVAAYLRYLGVAYARTHEKRGAVVIMHGYSGSGKSTVARRLISALGAVCIRSDVVRKRLHGFDEQARTGGTVNGGNYSDDATARTYREMLAHAGSVAAAGLPVVVDAAFLQLAHRSAFKSLAATLEVPFMIVDVNAEPEELRKRISARAIVGTDASEATLPVLDQQMCNAEPLTASEMAATLTATSDARAIESVAGAVGRRLAGGR